MARTKWADVRRTLSPEREAAGRAEVQEELAAMKLAELRHARRLSQATIAEVLDMRQGDVSKLERRTASNHQEAHCLNERLIEARLPKHRRRRTTGTAATGTRHA
jgi:DNA-binding transcriptional regulator YiaG